MGEIGRAAQQIRQRRDNCVDHLLRRLPAGNGRPFGRKTSTNIVQRLGSNVANFALKRTIVVSARSSIALTISIDPSQAGGLPARADGPPRRQYILRNFEWRMRPVQAGACSGNLLRPQRRPMRLLGALPLRCAIADHGAASDQRWTIRMPLLLQCNCDAFRIVAIDAAN